MVTLTVRVTIIMMVIVIVTTGHRYGDNDGECNSIGYRVFIFILSIQYI